MILRIFILSLFVALLAGRSFAAEAEADAAHAAFRQVLQESANAENQPPDWWQAHCIRVTAAADKFLKAHPLDPRRWQVAHIYAMYAKNLTSAAQSRMRRAQELITEGLETQEISGGDWSRLISVCIRLLADEVARAQRDGIRADLAPLRREIDRLAARLPDSEALVSQEMAYHRLLAAEDPAAAEEFMRKLAQSPNAAVASVATGRLRTDTLREKPLQMKFTALDGREVDLEKLRGKVVLLDFWATWCGPCVAEIPKIKAVYDRYHDRGFEVVGITLDAPNDGDKVKRFVAEKGMPWPQFLDPERRNRFATEFGVIAIPTQLLFGPDGRLAHAEARGEALECEVARLLPAR